jgi:hypothetical protein
MASGGEKLGATLATLVGAIAVAALALAGIFAGAGALERLARPTHPCPNPNCGKPVRQDETPCPSCGIELRWERR